MRTLTGSGTLIHDSITIPVSFTFQWNFELSNKNRARIIAVSTERAIFEVYETLPFFPWTFEGLDSDNRRIFANNLSLPNRQGKFGGPSFETTLQFNVQELQIGEGDEYDLAIFYIPNISIEYDSCYKEFDNQSNWSLTKIDLLFHGDHYNIELKRLQSIQKEKEYILNEKDFIATEIIVRKHNDKINTNEATTLIDNMLELLEIAYGDTIYWSEMQGILNNTKIYQVYRNTRYNNVSPSRQLIRVGYPSMLSNFIKKTFEPYQQIPSIERSALLELIRGVRFAAQRLNFPAPFIQLGSSIENCCAKILGKNKEYYIDKQKRKENLPLFRQWIEDNIVPDVSKVDLNEFMDSLDNNFSFLMQKNFRTRLMNLLHNYQINFETAWIADFVKKRNEAAHGGYKFNGKNDYIIWIRIASLFEKLILKRIMYDEAFWDHSTSPSEYKLGLM